MLTVGGLFSGIGGIELGLQCAGMQIKWMVEIDPFCQKVLAKHWPNVRKYGDVRDCGRHNLETVDLIAGGFPCQPHSYAGKRKGKADDRNLWPEYRRIIAELRPCWVLGENVPGIRTTMLDQVLSDLEGLAYTTGTLIVPACAFDAPHRRERVFIVAHTHNHKQNEPQSEIRQTDEWPKPGWPQLRVGRQGKDAAHATSKRETTTQQPGQLRCIEQSSQNAACTQGRLSSWWATEPDVGRVAHGVPNRVDRLKALGNAVVPQVAEWIGRQILETARRCS